MIAADDLVFGDLRKSGVEDSSMNRPVGLAEIPASGEDQLAREFLTTGLLLLLEVRRQPQSSESATRSSDARSLRAALVIPGDGDMSTCSTAMKRAAADSHQVLAPKLGCRMSGFSSLDSTSDQSPLSLIKTGLSVHWFVSSLETQATHSNA